MTNRKNINATLPSSKLVPIPRYILYRGVDGGSRTYVSRMVAVVFGLYRTDQYGILGRKVVAKI